MDSATLYLAYLPNIFWFNNFLRHETVFIEREEMFVKASFRNRCVITCAQGIQILSIPIIKGRDHHQLYKEVRISFPYNWQKKHWQSIRSAYGSTPYFEYYENKFEELYEKKFEFLFEFNAEMLSLLLSVLKIKKGFDFTSTYEKYPTDMVDLRSVKSSSERIEMPRYYQVFKDRNGFVGNLSIVDLLFHLGPLAKEYLLSLK